MIRKSSFLYILVLLLLTVPNHVSGQVPTSKSASEIKSDLEKLDVLGSVLYFAAHPDDENTRLIAWLANEKKYRTAYLSLTRGDGGQNLLGTQLGIELGMIRTQELLAARRTDGGEQYFSSAFDFGFSKTFNETFDFWNKEETLREAVFIIRKLRPDVIVTRFPPDERGGHGHHQASAILAHEAFDAAADPNKFPEQLDKVKPWKAKRLLWNTANFGGQDNTSESQLKIQIGQYNPLSGKSYGEIAAKSRSQHKSQGFGSAPTRGNTFEYFEFVAGDKPTKTLFDGIDTDWSRIIGAGGIHDLVVDINNTFDMAQPEKSVQKLILLHQKVQSIQDEYWKQVKLKSIEELILACAGYYGEAYVKSPNFAENKTFEVFQDAIIRRPGIDITVKSINGENINQPLVDNEIFNYRYTTTYDHSTQPYWLVKPYTKGKFEVDEKDFGYPTNQDAPSCTTVVNVEGLDINVQLPITYKYVSPTEGELQQPVQITPQLTAEADKDILLLQKDSTAKISVTFENHGQKNHYTINVENSGTAKISPTTLDLDFSDKATITKEFIVQASSGDAFDIRFSSGENFIKQKHDLEYQHIPSISWYPDLKINAQPIQLNIDTRSVAYIQGAGDLIPHYLTQIGIQVDEILISQISSELLKKYDAVVVGIRAYNVHPELKGKREILMSYVENGGTMLVQYNVNNSSIGRSDIGPFPFSVTRDRVTEEDSPVRFTNPSDEILNFPNKITLKDFDRWVQERGLYFVDNLDKNYRTPLEMHDKDEEFHNGSLIVGKVGKGKFVYTSISFFRQLPAGVPGAYRLFVNLLANEK